MRKKIVMAMVLGMAVMMTACSSGKEKTLSEKDLETMSEKQAEEAIIKFAEEYDKDMGIKKEATAKKETTKEETTEAEVFDPHQICDRMRVDPYELGLFEIFGLDENFPKPKEGFELKWYYEVNGCQMNPDTGETPEGVGEYFLRFEPKDKLYNDYMDEVEEYLNTIYADQGKYILIKQIEGNKPSLQIVELEKGWIDVSMEIYDGEFNISYFPLEKYEITGTVMQEGAQKSIHIEGGEYDGKDFTMGYPFALDGSEIWNELEEGQKVNIEFYASRNFSGFLSSDNGYISKWESL